MGETTDRCAVCGDPRTATADGRSTGAAGRVPKSQPVLRAGLSRVIIEGRTLLLCRAHAATVAAAMPETFDDLRALFTGMTRDFDPPPRGTLGGATPALAEGPAGSTESRPALIKEPASAVSRPASIKGPVEPLIERRSPIQRRGADDRRVFPPRPEGRRLGAGRRATDPYD